MDSFEALDIQEVPLHSSLFRARVERFLERDIQKNALPEGLGEAPEYQKSSPHKNSRGRGGRHRGVRGRL